MSKLAALKKQIAALEAQAERIAKTEMSSAIAKVKNIMAEFNLTIEHLTHSVAGKRAVKKAKAKTASVAKYADPKSGKTWSGVGRAPGWIAGAKDRDAFLVGRQSAASTSAKAPAAAKKSAAKAARRAAKPVAKKASASAKKAVTAKAASATAKKIPSARKAAAKKSMRKAASSKRADPPAGESTPNPAA